MHFKAFSLVFLSLTLFLFYFFIFNYDVLKFGIFHAVLKGISDGLSRGKQPDDMEKLVD